MICVYPADCTDFSTNGNGTIAPTSALVTETLNGEYELQLVHPIDEAGKWQRLVEGCILSWASRFDDASYEAKHLVIAQLVDRIEIRKNDGYDITIHWRMTAEQFLGRKKEERA